MRISTEHLQDDESLFEGVVTMRDGRYVLSQGDRHAKISSVPEEALAEREEDITAVKGYLSAKFEEDDQGRTETVGEFYLKALELGEVLGQTNDGRVVSRFEDGLYVSEVDIYDPDETGNEYELEDVGLPVW